MTPSDFYYRVLPSDAHATVKYLPIKERLRVQVSLHGADGETDTLLDCTLTPSAWRAFTDMFRADDQCGQQRRKWYTRSSHEAQLLLRHNLVHVSDTSSTLILTYIGALVRAQLPPPPASKPRAPNMKPTEAEIECLKHWPRNVNHAIPLNGGTRELVEGRWTTSRNGATVKLARMVTKGLLEMGLAGVRLSEDGTYVPDYIPEVRFRPTILGALLGGGDDD